MKFGDTIIKIFAQIFFQIKFILIMLQKYIMEDKMKKRITSFLLSLACVFSLAGGSYACTGFVAGKNATDDGSLIIARTEDLSGAKNKNFKVYPRKVNQAPVKFKDAIGFEIELPKVSAKYTAIADSEQSEGIYDEVGFNEYGVSMSATVSAGENELVDKFDPLVENGLSEASITTVVLPYIKSAKEGVQKVASIVDKQGSAEGNILYFADDKEIWYMEIYSGHQYAAVKVPDDKYAVMGNHFMLGYVDPKGKDSIASKDLINLPQQKVFLKQNDGKFHAALTYGEEMGDYDRVRVWGGQNKLSPSNKVDYNKPVFELFRKADKKISVKDVMELQRYRYEDTAKNANLPENSKVRAIGATTSMECHVIQMKKDLPKEVGGVMWLAIANAEHSVYLPFFGNINSTIEQYTNDAQQFDQNSFYWLMRGINVLSAQDRAKFGKNVRAYWSDYENKLIANQKAVDAELVKVYKEKGKDAAAKYATEISEKTSKETFDIATNIYSELMTYVAKNDGKVQKDPFMPSYMKKDAKTK